VFLALLDKDAPAGAKAYALENAEPRLAYVAHHLAEREWLLDTFSVADIYLATILNWAQVTPLKLAPPIAAFLTRMKARPAVGAALARETELYLAEQQARRSAS
jgi:glutathione S-transferase